MYTHSWEEQRGSPLRLSLQHGVQRLLHCRSVVGAAVPHGSEVFHVELDRRRQDGIMQHDFFSGMEALSLTARVHMETCSRRMR